MKENKSNSIAVPLRTENVAVVIMRGISLPLILIRCMRYTRISIEFMPLDSWWTPNQFSSSVLTEYVWPNNICTTYYLFIYQRTQRWKLKIKFHFENVFRWKERNIHFTLMQARTSIEIHKYSKKSKQAELSPSLCREPYCHWRTPFLLQLDLDIPVCVFSLSFSLKIKC